MSNKLVTVVVPVYNAEKYLKDCVDSILGQTYTNIDILLINDGSKDNSLNICKNYLKKDSRVRLIDKENTGVSDTRNTGIKEAKGDYIIFVDSDDLIESTMIEKLYFAIEQNDAQLAMCKFNLLINGKKQHNYENKLITQDFSQLGRDDFIKRLFIPASGDENNQNIMGSSCRCLVDINYIRENDIAFPNIMYMEDLIYVTRVLKYISKVVVVDDYLYNYRVNYNSSSYREDICMVEDRLAFLKIMESEINAFNLQDCTKKYIIDTIAKQGLVYCYTTICKIELTKSDRKKYVKILKQNKTLQSIVKLRLKTDRDSVVINLFKMNLTWLLTLLYNIKNK